MKEKITFFIDKAERSLALAKSIYDGGDYDFAVSRAYYAIFYVSEALLLGKGKSSKKHAAVISGIYEHFIKGGELPREFHSALNDAFRLRLEGDYFSDTEVTSEVAEELLLKVEKQVQLGINMLKSI